MQRRRVNPDTDRTELLEFHCRANYASETPYARRMPYERYREKWLGTAQPEQFLLHLRNTMKDPRTVAEIWQEGNSSVAYLWLCFTDVPDYGLTVAEVMDITVAPGHRRRGVARQLLCHAEDVAREHGATILRSDTGVDNTASRRLHEKMGFGIYRIGYEKVLAPGSERS